MLNRHRREGWKGVGWGRLKIYRRLALLGWEGTLSYTLFPPPGQGRGQRLASPEYGHAGGEPASRIGGSAIAAAQISRYGAWDAERALPMRQSAVGRLYGSAALLCGRASFSPFERRRQAACGRMSRAVVRDAICTLFFNCSLTGGCWRELRCQKPRGGYADNCG